MLQVKNYRKSYNGELVLGIPSAELPHNIYWLKGTNGSGKTTFIRSVAGLIPFDGQITMSGIDIRRQRTQYRSIINYAEAEPQYPGFLTGIDLITFYQDVKKAAPGQVRTLIEAFGIGSYAANKTSTYSSGMGKKLSLVLGFIGNPALILLDEPLITLDEASVNNLKELVQQYHAKGCTFIITSHQEMEFTNQPAMRLAVREKQLVQA